ncbi:MAG: serine protease [Phycisphaeraceae bacterium]|nr:MAG: serine protease [Phycisphaeraceae bacterium]
MRYLLALVVALLALPAPAWAQADGSPSVRDSVVKVYATYRGPSFERPWTKESPEEFTGSGFVIDGNRIVTNAHVVEQASQVFVQPPNSSDRMRAEVIAISQDIDLAILELRNDSERDAFFSKHPAVTFRDELPPIGSTVQAIGYPVGGDQQSVTEGVVSRIEFADYSQTLAGLRVQVDAALNPGNSGGPMVLGGEVIGVTFSGIEYAENIGYVIPVEEVNLFLDDVKDGTWNGKPRLHASGFQTTENPALRSRLGLAYEQTGLVYTAQTAIDEIPLQKWDLLDAVGGFDVDNAGLITIEDGLRVLWPVLLQRLGQGGSVPVTVVRDGSPVELTLPLDFIDRDVVQALGNAYPEYFVYGPLVFTKGYSEMGWWILYNPDSPIARRGDPHRQFEGEELVVVSSQLLPHPITKGYEIAGRPILKSVNGTKIKNLAHLVETLRDAEGEYLEFVFYDRQQEILIFSRDELNDSIEELLDDNGIRKQMSDAMRPHWRD